MTSGKKNTSQQPLRSLRTESRILDSNPQGLISSKPYDSQSSTLLLLDIFSLGSLNRLQDFFPLSNTALWFATLAFRTIFSNPLICNLHSVHCRKHVSLLSPLMTFQLMQFCMGKYVCIQVFFTVPNRILQRIHT